MSASTVPAKRFETRSTDVQIGAPVRAQTWREIAETIHWLRGHGIEIVPAHAPQLHIAKSGSAESLFYRVKGQGVAIARVWSIQIRQATAGPSTLTVTLPEGGVFTIVPPVISGRGAFDGVALLTETVAKGSAQEDLELIFTPIASDAQIVVESVSCFELPRAALTQDATDKGIDLQTLRPGVPIFDGANTSLGAVAEILTDAVTQPRRMLWQQSFPLIESDPGGAGNPTAWVDLFTLPMTMHPRRVLVGQTNYDAALDVRGFVEGAGDTFEVRGTAAISGDVKTAAVAGVTAEAWLMGPQTITLESEDVSTVDGVPSGGLETLQIAVRRTAGTGKISVRSVSVWEAS